MTPKTLEQLLSERARLQKTVGEAAAGVIASVPNKPKTPMHSFRVEDELWKAAKRRAEERGETLTEALRKFLRRYTK